MKTIYENTIKALGSCVDEFKGEGMFILFGDNAPEDCAITATRFV